MNEIYEYLKNAGIYYLATVNEGKPAVRPFGTIDLFEDKLYIQTGNSKNVSAQMKANPHIEISTMHDGTWLRISAEAYLDERIEAQTHMLDAYPSLQAMYQPGDGNTEVFYLKNAVAQICKMGTVLKEIKW